MSQKGENLTVILQAIVDGQNQVDGALVDAIYKELRAIAGRLMREERAEHTLNPTALVNEAYIKILGGKQIQVANRAHFFAIAARSMRQILCDHARGRGAKKRGGGLVRISIDRSGMEERLPQISPPTNLLILDDHLKLLEKLNPRQGQIMELRLFGGLEAMEIATVLAVPTNLVYREIRRAQGWLRAKYQRA